MSDTDDTVLAWHFTGDKLRDGRPLPADGETLRHDGPLVMCRSGFHASERMIDALAYAPGPVVWRVRCGVGIERETDKILCTDKLLCRERTGLWHYDATEVLGVGARQFAMDVAHLWDMPPIVRRYLEMGDQIIREAARIAAWVAWDAALQASARGAAMAAWNAAAPEASVRATWDAARNAVRAAARAARDADRNAPDAWDATWYATWHATMTATKTAQNIRLTAMIEEGRPDV